MAELADQIIALEERTAGNHAEAIEMISMDMIITGKWYKLR